jgi:phage-related protein
MQTFSAQVELLKNRITDMAIEIGSRLVPAIEPAVVWLQENLPTAFETAETVWREEVKPILEDIGKIIEDPVIPALKDLWEWFDKNEWAATGLAKAITAVTVALAALYVKMKVVTAIKGLFSVFTPLAKVVGYAGAIILTVIGVIWTSLNHLILGPFTLFIGLWAVLIMVVQRFSWIFVGAWNVVYEVFSTVMGFIFDHWRIFLTILTGGLFLFVAIFIAQWTHIREFFGGILGWMWDRVNDFWHLLQGAWNVITIAGVAVWHAIRWAAQHAWDWIMQRTEGIRSWLGDTAAWIGDRFSDAWEFIRWYAGQVWDWITEKIGGVVDWIKRQVDRIKGFVGEVGDALSSIPGAGVVKSGINFVFGSTGGIVPQYLAGGGMSRGMDTVPAMLTPGEMVLNAQQQRHLFNLIHTGDGTGVGSGGNTYVVINNPVISTEAQFENMVVNAIRSAGRKGTPITIRGRRL